MYGIYKKIVSSNNKKFVIFEIYVLMSAQCLSNQQDLWLIEKGIWWMPVASRGDEGGGRLP